MGVNFPAILVVFDIYEIELRQEMFEKITAISQIFAERQAERQQMDEMTRRMLPETVQDRKNYGKGHTTNSIN